MKRIIIFIMVLSILMVTSCTKENAANADPSQSGDLSSADTSSVKNAFDTSDELRGVWISYGEMGSAFEGDFYKNVDKMLDNIKNLGFNFIRFHSFVPPNKQR